MSSILTVSELTKAIKQRLESQFASISVKGEVTNLRRQSSGHLYFSLKDQEAQISAVLFRGVADRLKHLPKDGDQVLIKGELSVYAPRGSYQIIVRSIETAGVGELLLKLHELKKRLETEGYFDSARKKPLPPYPKTIGVITSPTGSVIQDILHILKRRFKGFHLVLYPVKVQGEGTDREIAQAISDMNRFSLADVLIVGRGGGSLEDLMPFNSEIVAKAIFESEIPIISAVGHETDVSIADFVADVRAPTPSAAAEISMKEMQAQVDFLQGTQRRCEQILSEKLGRYRERLQSISKLPIFQTPYPLLSLSMQKIDDITSKLRIAIENRLHRSESLIESQKRHLAGLNPLTLLMHHKRRVQNYRGQIDTLMMTKLHHLKQRCPKAALYKNLDTRYVDLLKQKREKLRSLQTHLGAIDPKNLLQKGYCIPMNEQGENVQSAKSAKMGDEIKLIFHDGTLTTEVKDGKPLLRKGL